MFKEIIIKKLKEIGIIILIIFTLYNGKGYAQTDTTWNGKSCAVVLTYDDGLDIDLRNVIPALDSLDLKGTFYISDYFYGLNAQVDGWRKAAAEGHELGNHTIWHPCDGSLPGRSFVKPDYDLSRYDVTRMNNEILAMNNILKAIDGKDERTFAYPCGDMNIHDSAYLDYMKYKFVATRGVTPEMLPINKVDLNKVGCYMENGASGEEMISLIKKAMQTHTLLVFLFHGVGGEHNINISLAAHSRLLHFLKQNEKDLWIAPMIDVAKFINTKQEEGVK